MMKIIQGAIGSSIMLLLSMMPTKAMSHLMFRLRNRPDITDRWGYHVRAIHYYEPIPDVRQITPVMLERPRVSPAIDFRVEGQKALLQRLGTTYGRELAELSSKPAPAGFDFSNTWFAGLDAAAYYGLIRDLKPTLVMEIGSGFSTQIASHAMQRNVDDGKTGKLLCVEPFPEARLTASGAKFDLVNAKVQDLPLEFFDQLQANDILLIDSSHVATVGSDVCFEFLDIMPRLKPGVWVHVHDIFFPSDYPADWVIEHRLAFNEQYILESFLAFNSIFTVQLANSWMWRLEHETSRLLFDGSGTGAPPASFWMRRDS